MTLVPQVAPSVLHELLSARGSGHAFFLVDDPQPMIVPAASFGAVSRTVLREVSGQLVHADAPEQVDPTLPLIAYGPETRFPLWGVPGQDEKQG